MRRSAVAVALALACPVPAIAQTASVRQLVAAGDTARDARHDAQALEDYLAALRANSDDVDALWRTSHTEVELAEFEPDSARADSLLASGAAHARAAVARAPHDPWARFALAQALGRIALRTPITSRLPLAREVHEQALACLAIAPQHEGCLHVLGLWHAEYMRMGYMSRQLADLMGGGLFAGASWAEAERNLRAAIAVDSLRAIHHFDLGRVLLEQGKRDSARAEFQRVLASPVRDYNDPRYRALAQAALDSL